MNNKKSAVKSTGVTLIEVFVSMLIFALIMAGLANLFVATKRQMLHVRSWMVAGELDRYFLDRLQMDVRQDTWNNSPADEPPPPYGTGNLIGSDDNYRTPNIPLTQFPQYSGYTELSWIDTEDEEKREEPELDGITYYPVYEIEDKDGLRKVRLTICWQEPSL